MPTFTAIYTSWAELSRPRRKRAGTEEPGGCESPSSLPRTQPCRARLCCCPVCQQRHLTSSWLSILIPGAKKAATAMQDSLAELPGWGKGILLHRPAFLIAATTTGQAGLPGLSPVLSQTFPHVPSQLCL